MIKTPQAWQITRGKGSIGGSRWRVFSFHELLTRGSVSIVDDGCQFVHPELSTQYVEHLSRNLNTQSGSGSSSDPSPDMNNQDFHGHACSGVATGHNNSVCGVGSAYEANLACVRLISEGTDDITEAEGLTVGVDEVSVYSCSWGPEGSPACVVPPSFCLMLCQTMGSVLKGPAA